MISYLKGTVLALSSASLIIERDGLGYRLTLPSAQLFKLQRGQETAWFVHEHQRDDGRELYGFATFEELELAEKLLTVSGVGPKIAQMLVGLGVEAVLSAIRLGDAALFLTVSGVGKKRAQQIILELKGSIDLDKIDSGDEVVEALATLGYGAKEVSSALKLVPRQGTTEERLRAALKTIGR